MIEVPEKKIEMKEIGNIGKFTVSKKLKKQIDADGERLTKALE